MKSIVRAPTHAHKLASPNTLAKKVAFKHNLERGACKIGAIEYVSNPSKTEILGEP